jgi:ribose transport system ATP-binding protein
MAPEPPLLSMSGITKSFPGVRALDGVDLDVQAGEVHCLLGQNGAGKSTLIKVLAGAHQPDTGRLRWRGEDVTLRSPIAAMRLGIATIYQELDLVEHLSVACRDGKRSDHVTADHALRPGDVPPVGATR